MLKILCFLVAVVSACNFTPRGVVDDPDAASLDAVLVDSMPADASVDALVASGLECQLLPDVNGTCEGVPRQVHCTAASAVSCTLIAPGAIPVTTGPISADANGLVVIDQQISFPLGLTTLTFTCKGGPGTSDASMNLPVRAARLTVPTAPVAVGQNMTVSFSAPDVVENNVVLPCSMSISSITNLYPTGMASNTFSWNIPGTLPIHMECHDPANQPMYACTKQVIVQ